ncbi:MAG TPA: hypothetical protein VH253_02555 [Phycisphaerae bacterium]|nr:hypothetical protein [Phycisphaerae bacterium]
MSDVQTPPAAEPAKWPASGETAAVSPPLTQAALANAAARAMASNTRRDLMEYLRLRRKR